MGIDNILKKNLYSEWITYNRSSSNPVIYNGLHGQPHAKSPVAQALGSIFKPKKSMEKVMFSIYHIKAQLKSGQLWI